MANTQAAAKYLRASQRRRMNHKPVRTRARHAVREALEEMGVATQGGDWADAEVALQAAVQALDSAAQKGVIHANNAARRKSRLLRRFHTLRDPERVRAPRMHPLAAVEVS